jgi:hypothetical protein
MPEKLTRRELALGTTGAAFLPQAQAQSTKPVDEPALDPVAWTRTRYAAAPLKLTFASTDRKDAEAWQRKLRAKVTELVGGFPPAKSAPVAQIAETRDFPGYKRERFFFESRPGVWVAGWLLTPNKGRAPYATVICVPGHGRGADDIVGIDEKGQDRTEKPFYQFDFAVQTVEHGMAAIAIEPMAFGCRRDEKTKSKGPGTSACQPTAGAALLLGETMVGWRVYDVMRTIDWIGTRKDLDVNRVGCMGISGGGTVTLFSTALDTRIKAALVSGYLNTFRDSILSLSHCIDNYVPGILNWAEMYDVGGLIAPRPMLAESGSRDPIFPINGSRESFAKVKRVYEVFGAGDKVEHDVFEGVHQFNGARGIPFLARHLNQNV